MPIDGEAHGDALAALYEDGRDWLGEVDWFDAHTHIGANDPDGVRATTAEILAGLDAAGHRGACCSRSTSPPVIGSPTTPCSPPAQLRRGG